MARGTLKSSIIWWNEKVGYSWPYMENEKKPPALMRWSQNNW